MISNIFEVPAAARMISDILEVHAARMIQDIFEVPAPIWTENETTEGRAVHAIPKSPSRNWASFLLALPLDFAPQVRRKWKYNVSPHDDMELSEIKYTKELTMSNFE